MQYELTWTGEVLFPKECKLYRLGRNEKGEFEAFIDTFPNRIPLGFEPDKYYKVTKDNVHLLD